MLPCRLGSSNKLCSDNRPLFVSNQKWAKLVGGDNLILCFYKVLILSIAMLSMSKSLRKKPYSSLSHLRKKPSLSTTGCVMAYVTPPTSILAIPRYIEPAAYYAMVMASVFPRHHSWPPVGAPLGFLRESALPTSTTTSIPLACVK